MTNQTPQPFEEQLKEASDEWESLTDALEWLANSSALYGSAYIADVRKSEERGWQHPVDKFGEKAELVEAYFRAEQVALIERMEQALPSRRPSGNDSFVSGYEYALAKHRAFIDKLKTEYEGERDEA